MALRLFLHGSWAKRMNRSTLAVASLGLLGLVPSTASAQDKTFYLDRLQIAGAPSDGVAIFRPEVGKTRLFGQLAFGYSLNPLRTDNHVDDIDKAATLKGPPVANQVATYLTAGAEILERGTIGVTFPLALYQNGDPNGNPVAAIGLPQIGNMKAFAPMDLRLDGRFLVFRNDAKTFKLAVRAAVFFPSGDALAFAGDSKTWANFAVATEYDLKKFFLTLNLGASLRSRAEMHELTVGNELTYGLGGYVPLMEDRIRIGLEIFGSAGLIPSSPQAPGDLGDGDGSLGDLDSMPVEWSVNGRMALDAKRNSFASLSLGSRLNGGMAPDFRAVLAVGGAFGLTDKDGNAPAAIYRFRDDVDTDKDGFPDLIDMCPVDPEDKNPPNPDDGCPDMPDKDRDGIPDISDKCVEVPEDKDGIDDRDGCPEDDADQDTVPDAEDKCPKEPGERGDDPEKEGCPQFVRRITGSSEIQITKQVEFEFDRAVILPKSYRILDEVVRLLKANPEIKLVSVEGHTDNVGKIEYNERLSGERAAAVRDYLINKGGIAAERLTSKGLGSAKPLATNDTDDGRARNRRVEFHIVSQAIEGR